MVESREIWKKLRKDEYLLNDKIVRMSKKKLTFIKHLDNAVLNDKRYG